MKLKRLDIYEAIFRKKKVDKKFFSNKNSFFVSFEKMYNKNMVKRLPFYVGFVISLVGLIVGSFYDLEISKSIAKLNSIFPIIVSAFAMYIGYLFVTFALGLLLAYVIKNIVPKWEKVLFSMVLIFGTLAIVYLCGRELFSDNGFNKNGVGYFILEFSISLLLNAGIFYVGYRVGKKEAASQSPIYIAAIIFCLAAFVSLVIVRTILISVMHRPRYRVIILGIDGVKFINWWDTFPNYKKYVDQLGSNAFKSFPSGHSGVTMLSMYALSFIPYFCPKTYKYQILFSFLGLLFSYFVAFTRILAGAHFLSDVAMGTLLTLIFVYIGNEVLIKKYHFDLQIIQNREK